MVTIFYEMNNPSYKSWNRLIKNSIAYKEGYLAAAFIYNPSETNYWILNCPPIGIKNNFLPKNECDTCDMRHFAKICSERHAK